MEGIGRQLIVEYYGCNAQKLSDVAFIEAVLVQAAEVARASVISAHFHHFSPTGVSGVVIIQESHLTIHTWPEYGYAAVDFFTCGDDVDPEGAKQWLARQLDAREAASREMLRGANIPRP